MNRPQAIVQCKKLLSYSFFPPGPGSGWLSPNCQSPKCPGKTCLIMCHRIIMLPLNALTNSTLRSLNAQGTWRTLEVWQSQRKLNKMQTVDVHVGHGSRPPLHPSSVGM